MIRLLSFIAFMLVCCSGGVWAAWAAEPASVTVASVYENRQGVDVPVGVFIDNPDNISSGILELQYNPKMVKPTDVAQGEVFNGLQDVHFLGNLSNTKDGIIRCVWAIAQGGIDREGKLLQITFKTLAANATTDITVKQLQISDVNYKNIPVHAISGGIASFNGENIKPKEPAVAADKSWTIKFSRSVDPRTINNHTIYVLNNAGVAVDTNVAMGADGESVTVKPVDKYVPGSYTLVIPQQAKSADGMTLQSAVKMQFTVQ